MKELITGEIVLMTMISLSMIFQYMFARKIIQQLNKKTEKQKNVFDYLTIKTTILQEEVDNEKDILLLIQKSIDNIDRIISCKECKCNKQQ